MTDLERKVFWDYIGWLCGEYEWKQRHTLGPDVPKTYIVGSGGAGMVVSEAQLAYYA